MRKEYAVPLFIVVAILMAGVQADPLVESLAPIQLESRAHMTAAVNPYSLWTECQSLWQWKARLIQDFNPPARLAVFQQTMPDFTKYLQEQWRLVNEAMIKKNCPSQPCAEAYMKNCADINKQLDHFKFMQQRYGSNQMAGVWIRIQLTSVQGYFRVNRCTVTPPTPPPPPPPEPTPTPPHPPTEPTPTPTPEPTPTTDNPYAPYKNCTNLYKQRTIYDSILAAFRSRCPRVKESVERELKLVDEARLWLRCPASAPITVVDYPTWPNCADLNTQYAIYQRIIREESNKCPKHYGLAFGGQLEQLDAARRRLNC
jgi:hypothetical protein